MRINLREKHFVQTCNYCHFTQPFVHYDRIMVVHDFIYLEQGTWEIYEDDIPYRLFPGDILFLEAGKHHYGLIPCDPDTRTIFIHMYTNPSDGEDGPDTVDIPTYIHAGEINYKKQFENIVNLWWSDETDSEYRCSSRLELLLCDLGRKGNCESGISNTWPISAVHKMVIQAPEKNYTINEFAQVINISERQLRYQFQILAGETVHQYQTNLKLRMAQQIIATEPWRTINDIAQGLGFCDQYHFSKQFKNKFGISPSSFKRKGN